VASGLLPWSALRESLETASGTLADNRWIRRTRMPLELLVSRVVLASGVRAVAGIVLVLGYALSRDLVQGPGALVLPVVAVAAQVVACFGLGLALSPLAVLYPDLRPGIGSALTLATFASPILYPESLVPPRLLGLLEWNPFTHFLRLYRAPLGVSGVGGAELGVVLLVPVALVLLGWALSRRLYWPARDRL
jgi:ABC-type polysaccharide/polyol phosphate export permease